MAISDKLQDLIDIKQDIKVAIEDKGSDLTDVAFDGYAAKIDELPLPKEEQTKTVSSPDFSSGNVVVTPDTGKVLTQVTVVKDNDLVPENIVKDVNIFGVVGTAETGGVDLSKVIPIAFELYVSKPNTNYSLKYSISSTMLDKRFFFDINGNSYLPSEVSVYFDNTFKGMANKNMTLYSSSKSYAGISVKFKVGELNVGIPTYYYTEESVIVWTTGVIEIAWSNQTGTKVSPHAPSMRFIQAPNDLFDNFPHYDRLDYWNADNMFSALSNHTNQFIVGWDANYVD